MRCDGRRRPAARGGATPAEPVGAAGRARHIESCLRCQAELARYRTHAPRPPARSGPSTSSRRPGCSPQTLAALDRGERAPGASARRSPGAASPTPAPWRGGVAAAGATDAPPCSWRRPAAAPLPRLTTLDGLAGTHRARSRVQAALRILTGARALEARRLRPNRPRAPVRRAVAQLAEHRSPKPAVGGSSPSCPAAVTTRPAPRHGTSERQRPGEPTDQAHDGEAGRRQAARARAHVRSRRSSPRRRARRPAPVPLRGPRRAPKVAWPTSRRSSTRRSSC